MYIVHQEGIGDIADVSTIQSARKTTIPHSTQSNTMPLLGSPTALVLKIGRGSMK